MKVNGFKSIHYEMFSMTWNNSLCHPGLDPGPRAAPDPGSNPGRHRQAKLTDVGSFLGLVVIAQVKHPIPSRTRQLSTAAPMVLRLKAWESRSLPNLVRNWGLCLSDDGSCRFLFVIM